MSSSFIPQGIGLTQKPSITSQKVTSPMTTTSGKTIVSSSKISLVDFSNPDVKDYQLNKLSGTSGLLKTAPANQEELPKDFSRQNSQGMTQEISQFSKSSKQSMSSMLGRNRKVQESQAKKIHLQDC